MWWLRLSLWLGIISLYLGFAGVMGVLLRRAVPERSAAFDQLLALTHAFLLYLPASFLVGGLADWPLEARLGLLAAGVGLVWLGAFQPDWLPHRIWKRGFLQRYFAGAMGMAAIWGVGLAYSAQAPAALLVGAAATVAGAASLYTAPRNS